MAGAPWNLSDGSAPWVARLRELGYAPELAVLADHVAARGWTEVYSGSKGRGLRAARDIPAGTLVALFAGKHVDHDGCLTPEEYPYYAVQILGDLDCLPPEVNGSLANDMMGAEEFAQLRRGLPGFAAAYYPCVSRSTAELRWLAPGLADLRAARDLARGEPLEYCYGFDYWAQLVASGAFGVSWEVAWGACREITHGDPARDETVLQTFGLSALPPDRRVNALADLGLNPRLPFYFERLGIRVYYCGVRGVTHHGTRGVMGGAVFLTPPNTGLAPEEKQAPFAMAGENLRLVADFLARRTHTGCGPGDLEGRSTEARARDAALQCELLELLRASHFGCSGPCAHCARAGVAPAPAN